MAFATLLLCNQEAVFVQMMCIFSDSPGIVLDKY